MIVTCPACSARYRIDIAKIKGRGAKITCPRCAHKFVVYKEKETQDTADLDFSSLAITWSVKKGLGVISTFHSLGELLQMIESGQADEKDTISYDNRTWIPLHSIDNLAGFFLEIWKRAERGELKIAEHPHDDEEIDEEEDSPTTVIKDRDLLLKHLRDLDDDMKDSSETKASTDTPGTVYRTRSAPERPSYLPDETGESGTFEEQVIGVESTAPPSSSTLKTAPEKTEPEGPQDTAITPVPPNPTVRYLIAALIFLVTLTSAIATIEYFKLDLPFVSRRVAVQPQMKPNISTPTERPFVPDRESKVPTEKTAPLPAENGDGEPEKALDKSENNPPTPAPPTGEIEPSSGETQ